MKYLILFIASFLLCFGCSKDDYGQAIRTQQHEESIALIDRVILADKNKEKYIILNTDNEITMELIVNRIMLKDGWSIEGGIASTNTGDDSYDSTNIYQALRKTNSNLYLWRDSNGKLWLGGHK